MSEPNSFAACDLINDMNWTVLSLPRRDITLNVPMHHYRGLVGSKTTICCRLYCFL